MLLISTEMLRERTAHARLIGGRIQNGGQSRRVPASRKAGDLKFLTHVAEKYFYANILKNFFVTTYGTSVWRKRVNIIIIYIFI